MPFLGPKTKEVLEQEIFSITNMVIKRDFYTADKMSLMRVMLKELCVEYIKLS